MVKRKSGELFTQLTLETFKLSGMISSEGDQLTKAFGLTSARWKILGALDMSDMPLTMSQIGRVMGQSRQAVQRQVDVMIKEGLVTLEDNPNHKRAKYVAVTPKGNAIREQLYRMWEPKADQFAAGFTRQELETTLSVVQRLSLELGAEGR